MDKQQFQLKKAGPQDVPLILAFIKELAEYEKLLDMVVADEALLHEALFGTGANTSALIARYEGKPIGFCLYFHNFSTFLGRKGLYLEDVYIQPAYRGKGFGKKILAYLAQVAIDTGCGRFEWAVLDWNEPSIAFYKSLGAVPMDEWTVFRLTSDKFESLAKQY